MLNKFIYIIYFCTFVFFANCKTTQRDSKILSHNTLTSEESPSETVIIDSFKENPDVLNALKNNLGKNFDQIIVKKIISGYNSTKPVLKYSLVEGIYTVYNPAIMDFPMTQAIFARVYTKNDTINSIQVFTPKNIEGYTSCENYQVIATPDNAKNIFLNDEKIKALAHGKTIQDVNIMTIKFSTTVEGDPAGTYLVFGYVDNSENEDNDTVNYDILAAVVDILIPQQHYYVLQPVSLEEGE